MSLTTKDKLALKSAMGTLVASHIELERTRDALTNHMQFVQDQIDILREAIKQA